MKKKTIAKHTLGLIGVGILWFILNEVLDQFLGGSYHEYRGEKGYWSDHWDTNIDDDGGFLLLGMLVGYLSVCVIYWAVKTIWFTKDED